MDMDSIHTLVVIDDGDAWQAGMKATRYSFACRLLSASTCATVARRACTRACRRAAPTLRADTRTASSAAIFLACRVTHATRAARNAPRACSAAPRLSRATYCLVPFASAL